MYLRFYDSSGRQVGHLSTTTSRVKSDKAWGIKNFKRVVKIVTQCSGKATCTEIIINRRQSC